MTRDVGENPTSIANFNIMNEIKNLLQWRDRLLTVATDCVQYDDENKVPVCHSCNVELDESGNGHLPNCIANIILSECPKETLTCHADTGLMDAASALIEKMEAVYNMPEYQSVWTSYANHGGDYEHGPKWVDEFETLKITLKNHEQRSEG